jgi:uncharacterized metal-binding protein
MHMKKDSAKVLVIPCSGIGKVHGLISRECAYLATDELAPTETDVVCLALLVREDEETLARVRAHPCITIDGCAKACAQKNVEIAGGQVAKTFLVARVLSSHRGVQPGSGSELTESGWTISREIAEAVAGDAARLCAGEEVA